MIMGKFLEPANKILGESTKEGNKVVWLDEQNAVIAERISDSKHAHFHWVSP